MQSLLPPFVVTGALAAAVAFAAEPEAPLPSFSLPVQCRVGVDCEIQNYVDRDPSPAAKDNQCGSRTYQDHNGTDIRLPDMARQRAGVAVLAAAEGRVLRVRDGVADISVKAAGPLSVANMECGNGVVVDHGGGWQTQYCHMANGSIGVKAGDAVKAGDPIGRVGLSGNTEYPHLHFSVRQGETVVDPFAYGQAAGACSGGRSLWRPELRQALAYKPRAILNVGFTASQATMETIEAGTAEAPAGSPFEILAVYVRAIGLKADDMQELTLTAPDGTVVSTNRSVVPRDQAQRFFLVGKRRPAEGWKQGRYEAVYTVRQGGQVVLSRTFARTL